ncbi:MAG: DUF2691 family protein, partial [Clostridia bacterium]|nr:DUF2691 family protein [Clostridia bacterium]
MIVGINFIIPQVNDTLLWKILNPIDPSNYYWYIDKSQTEVWNEDGSNDLFEKETYTGIDFSNHIKCKHKIIFLKAIANSFNVCEKTILTYEDFLRSDCQLVLLIYDCEFVEIYSKSFELLSIIENNAKDLG